jgi:hypothetical protein
VLRVRLLLRCVSLHGSDQSSLELTEPAGLAACSHAVEGMRGSRELIQLHRPP